MITFHGTETRMLRFTSAMIDERAARLYLHITDALSEIVDIEQAAAVTELIESVDDPIRAEERYEELLTHTQTAVDALKILDDGYEPKITLSRGDLGERRESFTSWVREDSVGAALFVADLLDRAYEAALIDSPSQAGSPANRSLQKAARSATRLAEELAKAKGESFERAKADAREWRTEPSLAQTGPMGMYETAVEAMFPGRATTRKWLENLPVTQLGILAHGIHTTKSFMGIHGVDQLAARRAWSLVQRVNGHVVTGAAEALKADPRPEFPVASLARMKEPAPFQFAPPPGLYSPRILDSRHFSPEAYVSLIEQEFRRITPDAVGDRGARIRRARVPLSNSFLMPPDQAGSRSSDLLESIPPWRWSSGEGKRWEDLPMPLSSLYSPQTDGGGPPSTWFPAPPSLGPLPMPPPPMPPPPPRRPRGWDEPPFDSGPGDGGPPPPPSPHPPGPRRRG